MRRPSSRGGDGRIRGTASQGWPHGSAFRRTAGQRARSPSPRGPRARFTAPSWRTVTRRGCGEGADRWSAHCPPPHSPRFPLSPPPRDQPRLLRRCRLGSTEEWGAWRAAEGPRRRLSLWCCALPICRPQPARPPAVTSRRLAASRRIRLAGPAQARGVFAPIYMGMRHLPPRVAAAKLFGLARLRGLFCSQQPLIRDRSHLYTQSPSRWVGSTVSRGQNLSSLSSRDQSD